MYEYFSLLNVILFGVVFTFIAFLGRKVYQVYKATRNKY